MKYFVMLMLTLAGINHLNGQNELEKFPQLKAKSLKKEKITFPDDLTNEINILILVFQQDAQRLVDTWAKIILSEFEPQTNISYYEVPMVSTLYIPIAWQVDNWMRAGIPEQYHDNTTTFYGNRSPYFKKLNMDEKDSCYLFIVDQSGYIQFRTEGARTSEKETAFRNAITSLSK